MPAENTKVEFRGEASMEMLSVLGPQNIKARFIPVTMAYDHYLSGLKMNISVLEL